MENTGITTRRRGFILEPGESLLFNSSAMSVISRWTDFKTASGLEDRDFHVSPLVAIPVPRYPVEWPAGRKRWVGTRPDFMWHPFMWMPQRLRAKFVNGDYQEDDTELALRVALEMERAGFYDVQTGQWLDILSMNGLDIEDKETQARVSAWMAGADDDVLDSIDLEPQFSGAEAIEAWQDVYNMFPGVQGSQWAIFADDFGADDTGLISQLRSNIANQDLPVQRIAHNTAVLCWMGSVFFDGALDEESINAILLGGWGELVRHSDELQGMESPTAEEVSRVLDYMSLIVARIYEIYMPVLQSLTSVQASGIAQLPAH